MKAVIFDMDGVLIDSEPIYYQVNRELFQSLGFDVSPSEYSKYVGAPAYRKWDDLKPRYNITIPTEELIAKERQNYYRHLLSLRGTLEAIEGVYSFLQSLKDHGLKIAIASSSDLNVIIETVTSIGIRRYFDVLVTTDMVANGKPAADIFVYAAGRLDEKVADCLVIEDSYNGVKGGKTAGMKVLGFVNTNSGYQDLSLADYIIDSFIDLDWTVCQKMLLK